MASSPAKICALIDPVLLLQTATARQDPAVVTGNFGYLTAIGEYGVEASIGDLVKQRVSNTELMFQYMEQRPQKIQERLDQVTLAEQTQTADSPKRLDR